MRVPRAAARGSRMRRRRPRASTAGAAYVPRLGPPLLQGLAQAYALPEPLLLSWWRALCAAQWSEACAWREAVICWRPTHPTAQAFWAESCTPGAVMAVVEALVREGTLYRQTASQIETRLLASVTHAGTWVGHPSPTAPRPAGEEAEEAERDLAAVIERYWR